MCPCNSGTGIPRSCMNWVMWAGLPMAKGMSPVALFFCSGVSSLCGSGAFRSSGKA